MMLVPAAFATPAAPGPITTQGAEPISRSFAFGSFVLQPERQRLLRDGTPVPIGGRALDLLTALVEKPGQLLSKEELVSRAWPSTFVEQSNLKVNIGSLRRVLGDSPPGSRFIATVIGRGYRFVDTVRCDVHGGVPGADLATARWESAQAGTKYSLTFGWGGAGRLRRTEA